MHDAANRTSTRVSRIIWNMPLTAAAIAARWGRTRRDLLRPVAAAAVLLLTGCGAADRAVDAPDTLVLTGPGFAGGMLPQESSCDGHQLSPALSWKSPPAGTGSYALIVTDRDSMLGLGAVFGYFVHWLVYDIPAGRRGLPANLAKQAQLPDGSRQGRNGFDAIGYGGPCPPGHSPHRYVFVLYALDSKLHVADGAGEQQLLQAMRGHVLARGELIGRFAR